MCCVTCDSFSGFERRVRDAVNAGRPGRQGLSMQDKIRARFCFCGSMIWPRAIFILLRCSGR